MKILFDHQIFSLQALGGISKYILNLNNVYNSQGIQSKISSLFHCNKYLRNLTNEQKFVYYLKEYPRFTRKIINISNQINLLLDINKFKPEIIHKTYYSVNNISNKKIKIAITVYDLIHEIFYKNFYKKNNHLAKKESLSKADIIFCISHVTKEDLLNYYNVDEKKIFVVHLGVNAPGEIQNIKIINQPYILYVGDRKRYKNFYNLAKAYSISSYLNKNFKMCIVGGGEFSHDEVNYLKDMKINFESIIKLDATEHQLENLYQNAELFIYPSLYEGFGLPNLEAMANSCLVTCSNINVLKEVCGDAVAAYFDPNSPEDIADKIEKVLLLGSKKKNYIELGKKLASEFTWGKCANKTLSVYKKFLR